MPYIRPDDRRKYEVGLDSIFAASIGKTGGLPTGELNYLITVLVDKFVEVHGGGYGAINSAVGALECAKLELYRRVAAPYEDKKIGQNTDVYRSETV